MHELLAGGLTFVSIFCLGAAVLTASASRRTLLRQRLETLSGHVKTKQKSGRLVEMLRKFGEVISIGPASPRLQKELTQAGYHNTSAATIFLGVKTLLLLSSLVGLGLLALRMDLPMHYAAMLIVSGAGTLFFLPNAVVTSRRRKRSANLRAYLPDAVDLLEICVSSGMGLDAAWNMVSDDIRPVSQTLADEMSLTSFEMHLGAGRLESMRHMCQRVDVDELESLIVVLVQSERFGTCLADALKIFAGSMRELRSMRAQEAAERMAVRLLFPMVMFIFPAVFLILLGPAAMSLIKFWN